MRTHWDELFFMLITVISLVLIILFAFKVYLFVLPLELTSIYLVLSGLFIFSLGKYWDIVLNRKKLEDEMDNMIAFLKEKCLKEIQTIFPLVNTYLKEEFPEYDTLIYPKFLENDFYLYLINRGFEKEVMQDIIALFDLSLGLFNELEYMNINYHNIKNNKKLKFHDKKIFSIVVRYYFVLDTFISHINGSTDLKSKKNYNLIVSQKSLDDMIETINGLDIIDDIKSKYYV